MFIVDCVANRSALVCGDCRLAMRSAQSLEHGKEPRLNKPPTPQTASIANVAFEGVLGGEVI